MVYLRYLPTCYMYHKNQPTVGKYTMDPMGVGIQPFRAMVSFAWRISILVTRSVLNCRARRLPSCDRMIWVSKVCE